MHLSSFLQISEMNAESSRSHLVIGIVIECTNLTNGAVHRGKVYHMCAYSQYKLNSLFLYSTDNCSDSQNIHTDYTTFPLKLSLVDLAGSERASKTGSTAEQLKVNNTIET